MQNNQIIEMIQVRDFMIEKYLDFVNNYLTVAKFAEHNGLHKEEAEEFIQLAKDIYYNDHPDK